MIEQGSAEWHQQRAGKITASRFADVITINSKTGKPTAARDSYMREIVASILSGRPRHEIGSKSLSWGREVEGYAREAYELETGRLVVPSKFLLHPEYDYIGASPDGLVGDDGGIEVKCPHDEAIHILTYMKGMPKDHIPQVQGNMLVTGRKWWDFISYDPRQATAFRLYHQPVIRDDAYINDVLLPGLQAFWLEVQEMLAHFAKVKSDVC